MSPRRNSTCSAIWTRASLRRDRVFEREYRTKTVHQGYIEPQNATAWWSPDGRLTVWCSSQGHFGVRDNTARITGYIPRLAGEGGAAGDRRRIRRKDSAVPGADRVHPVQEERTSSQDGYGQDRGASGDWTDIRQLGGGSRWALRTKAR